VVVLGVAISHWTATQPGPDATSASAAVAISRQIGTSVAGNDRPVVTKYDGLMIRRCDAVGLYANNVGNATNLRRQLHAAAGALGLTLTDLSADVLSAATLEKQSPDVVACLPPGASPAMTERLLATRRTGEDHHAAESVLVHELKFTIRPVHTTATLLAAAVDREGILSDTLGGYAVDTKDAAGQLVISYTGPLLSDTEVDGVRDAIARQGGTTPANVSVTPLSAAGQGIDLATEAPAAPASAPTASPQHH
jgi:hypothetical protein